MVKLAMKHSGTCKLRKDAFTSHGRSASTTNGHSTSRWTPSYILLTLALGINTCINTCINTYLFTAGPPLRAIYAMLTYVGPSVRQSVGH